MPTGSVPRWPSTLSTSRLLTSQLMLGNMQAKFDRGKVSMMASLDHTMWFHEAFHVAEWLLLVVRHCAYPD